MKNTGVEQAINAAKWDKKSTWLKLAKKLGIDKTSSEAFWITRYVKTTIKGAKDNE